MTFEETQCRLRAAAVIEPVSATVLNKFNEVLFNVTDTGAVVYSEQAQSFTGLYTIPMKAALSF